jgi:O-antigen/teichoic acid export membrane protein
MMILSVFNMSINTVVMKFVATFKAKSEFAKVESLWRQLIKIFAIGGGVVFVIIALSSPFIAQFLKIDSAVPVVVLGFVIWVSLIGIVSSAVLNGLQQFFKLNLYQFIGAVAKLALSVGLVLAGFKAAGALAGFILMQFVVFLLAWPFISKLSKGALEKVKVSIKEPLIYSLPVTLSTLGLTMLYTLDVILVKRFLPGVDAGLYGSLSVIGRVVLFGTAPVTLVMFPLISERLAQKRPYNKILLFSAGLILFGGLFVSAIYFVFPKLVMDIFFGEKFYAGLPLLGWFGLLLTLYSLCNLLTQFFLSLESKRVWVLTGLAALVQGVGISVYHSSITQVLIVSFITIGGLLLVLIFAVLKPNLLLAKSPVKTAPHKQDAH